MTRIDWGKERQRLTEHYAAMADGALQKIAAQFSALTAMAQETLRTEMNSRGIQLTAAESANSRDNGAADKSVPVLIAQYLSVPEAILAKSILESAGIESFLADESLVRIDWLISNILGGVKLFVLAEDVEAAKNILEQIPPERFEVDGVGEFIQPHCPTCRSTDVSFAGPEKPRSYMSRFIGESLSVIPDDADDGQYWECRACGSRWKDESPKRPPLS
jgi:Putative prokaryotic signal transducing protein